jgi:hypothetical protein
MNAGPNGGGPGPAPPPGPPANETLEQFLDRREKELLARVSALRGQLNPAEAELAQIQHMKGMIVAGAPNSANFLLPQRNHNSSLEEALRVVPPAADLSALAALNSFSPLSTSTGVGYPWLPSINPRFATATIKELVIQALLDGFPNGATMMEIRDFIRAGYGREIQPSSLRPQMHRLKTDQVLGQDPATDTWNFRDGKRTLYSMYDHPTSRRAMRELQDEPELTEDSSDEAIARVIEARGLLGQVTIQAIREQLRKSKVT